MLPGLDGFEIMERIHGREIPVIFLTARDKVDDRVRGLKMGAEDYIVKPFEPRECWLELKWFYVAITAAARNLNIMISKSV
jgi:DNA-binding response OmpR family regulator